MFVRSSEISFSELITRNLSMCKVKLFQGQWFSTFLNFRHTNFENKFGGTPNCKKRDHNDENMVVLHTFIDL